MGGSVLISIGGKDFSWGPLNSYSYSPAEFELLDNPNIAATLVERHILDSNVIDYAKSGVAMMKQRLAR